MLEEKQSKGHALDDQQIAKLHTRSALENSLAELGVPIETMQAKVSSVLLDGKGSKKGEVLKKQRKSKQKGQVVVESADSGVGLEPHPIKDFLDVQICQVKHKKLGSSGQRNVTRCGLWWVEMLKTRDQFKEAATVYFCISGEEPLHSAVMLEQASYCYLFAKPPMLRKYGFHLVLSGDLYKKCDQMENQTETKDTYKQHQQQQLQSRPAGPPPSTQAGGPNL